MAVQSRRRELGVFIAGELRGLRERRAAAAAAAARAAGGAG